MRLPYRRNALNAAKRARPVVMKTMAQNGVSRRCGFSPSSIVPAERSKFCIQLSLGIHDGFVDMRGAGSQTGNGHKVAFASGIQGGLANGVQVLAKVFN